MTRFVSGIQSRLSQANPDPPGFGGNSRDVQKRNAVDEISRFLRSCMVASLARGRLALIYTGGAAGIPAASQAPSGISNLQNAFLQARESLRGSPQALDALDRTVVRLEAEPATAPERWGGGSGGRAGSLQRLRRQARSPGHPRRLLGIAAEMEKLTAGRCP